MVIDNTRQDLDKTTAYMPRAFCLVPGRTLRCDKGRVIQTILHSVWFPVVAFIVIRGR